MGSVLALLVLCGCRAVTGSTPSFDAVPSGLTGDHVLLAVDYLVHDPVLDGVYDPRLMTLTADGTLVLERRDVDAVLGATATRLDAAGLEGAWSAIFRSGVFVDGNLELPGFARQTVTTATNEFRVDDGSRSTRLAIDDLGSELIYRGDPPIPEAEMGLREAATQLMDDLRALDGGQLWTPPALLLWWRSEAPADWDATIVSWSPAIDLGRAGPSVEHPVWDRCARLDGEEAAGVARFAQTLPIDHLVEQDGLRYAIDVRPIHPDEIDQVACP